MEGCGVVANTKGTIDLAFNSASDYSTFQSLVHFRPHHGKWRRRRLVASGLGNRQRNRGLGASVADVLALLESVAASVIAIAAASHGDDQVLRTSTATSGERRG
jgi:hypothetical protein